MIVVFKLFVLIFVTFVVGQKINYDSNTWKRFRAINLLQQKHVQEKSLHNQEASRSFDFKDPVLDYITQSNSRISPTRSQVMDHIYSKKKKIQEENENDETITNSVFLKLK